MAHVQKRCSRCQATVPPKAQRCPACGGREVVWRGRYRGPDGKERSQTFQRKIDAERFLSNTEADKSRGGWIDPALGRMTFEEWVGRWEGTTLNLRPTTRALNMGVVRNYLTPRFGRWPLARITTADVSAMVAEDVASRRLSSSAVRRHVLVLSTILKGAVADGRIVRNPCSGVKLPPELSREMRFLEPNEIGRLVAAHPAHYRPLVLTAAYLGLRWGELAGLRLEKVDLLRRRIRVDEQLAEVGGQLSFGPPKTKAGTRIVSIPSGLVDVLAEHFAGPAVQSSGLAFPGPKGGALRRSGFRRVWSKACDRAKLEGLVFHELRHTAAALAIAQGAHPLAIKERLGHSSITVTMDRYGGLFPRLDEAIAEGLDSALRESLAASTRPEDDLAGNLRALPLVRAVDS
jgi:integrase